MRTGIKKAIGWISLIIFFAMITVNLVHRFKNPELTETQLFLNLWWTILIMIISGIGANLIDE